MLALTSSDALRATSDLSYVETQIHLEHVFGVIYI
jgi:hypothetical protein